MLLCLTPFSFLNSRSHSHSDFRRSSRSGTARRGFPHRGGWACRNHLSKSVQTSILNIDHWTLDFFFLFLFNHSIIPSFPHSLILSFSHSIIHSFYYSYFFLLVGNSLLVVLFYIIITQSFTEKSRRFAENKVMRAFRGVSHWGDRRRRSSRSGTARR